MLLCPRLGLIKGLLLVEHAGACGAELIEQVGDLWGPLGLS